MLKALLATISGIAAIAASVNDVSAQPSLKEVFRQDFLIGAALNPMQFSGTNSPDYELIRTHFNTITPENTLKWLLVHPQPDKYDFSGGDRFVEFGQKHGMTVIGHTLVWHSQAPRWVFEDKDGKPMTREALIERMHDHIQTVVGHYKGKIRGWDVVNEALNEDGSLRQSQWLKIIGEDYLVKAFQFAHEADPDAELYYNDYNLEDAPKRTGALALVKKLQAAGVKLTGVGLQGHYHMDKPTTNEIRQTIESFAKLGLKVMITELDIDVLPTPDGAYSADVSRTFAAQAKWNPYTNGLPAEMEKCLADRYADIFRVFMQEREALTRVTFWGVTDRGTWLNNFPVRGRTNYPLLFDRYGKPKAAFRAVVEAHSPTTSK